MYPWGDHSRQGGKALKLNTAIPPDPAAPISAQSRTRLLGMAFGICALSFALVGLLPGIFYGVMPIHDYIVFHIAFEFLSIVVSFAVFTIGWYGYKQTANRQDLVIGITFLTVGLIDFAHVLSYSGMPAFLSPNSVSKAATYWVAARLVDGIGILIAAFVVADSRRRLPAPGILAAGVTALVAAFVAVVSYYPQALPPMFVPGQGLTPLKIGLEWTVIALYALSVYVFGRRGHGASNIVLLQSALVVGIFSELSFTLYASAFDTYNVLGHLYKVAAYLMIFRAVFVSSLQRPYYQLVKARDQIEQSFSRIGTALASSLDSKQVLQLIAEIASDMLGARSSAVMLTHDGELRIEAQIGMLVTGRAVSPEHTAAGMAMSGYNPVVIDDVSTIPGHDPDCHCQHLEGPPAKSVVSASIISDKHTLGVIQVYSPRSAGFGPREAELLSSFARQAAVAIRNSIAYEREHHIAEMLQLSLLPKVPDIPGMDIAVRYIPAEQVAEVGGDLYDVFALDDGKLALVIGDVSGHGLDAASMMAMTVYTLRGLLLHGMPPGEAFELTNSALARNRFGDMRFVTVFAGVLDTKNRTIQYANAGHMMPVMLREGVCISMEQHSGLPLAIDESAKYQTTEADLSGVNGILLYTDGLTEVRRQGKMFGVEGLTAVCAELLSLPSEGMIDKIVDRARSWSAGVLHDDIACLAVKWERTADSDA